MTDPAPQPKPLRGVTARALIAGLILTPLNVAFIVNATMSEGGSRFPGQYSLFVNTVTVLFVLTLINRWLKRRHAKWGFGAGEMLTIYVMLGTSTGLISSAFDLGGSLAGTITYPFWFATEENGWRELLWPNLPTWLTVQEPRILEGFYVGQSSALNWAVIRAWATPAVWYAAFVGAIMWVCLCMNSIVRRRWEDEERLPFPMTVLPLQLVDEGFGLLRNRLWWLGIGLSLGLGVWNSIAGLLPALPSLPLAVDYTSYVENHPPWNFLRACFMEWYPFAIGLCYLVPLDLAFSLLVFDLFWTAEYVLAGHFGWSTSPWGGQFPYGAEQTAGSFIALALSVLWLDRRYLLQVGRRALGFPSALGDESQEAFGYRGAVMGLFAGLAFLWWFLARGGMPPWVVVGFLAGYFSMGLVISRLRAQLGPPNHELSLCMPNHVLPVLFGTRLLGPRSMGMLDAIAPFLREQRNNPNPLQLEAFRMAEGGRMERRRIAIALAVVPPLTVLCYFAAVTEFGYRVGFATGSIDRSVHLAVSRNHTMILDNALRYPAGTDASASLAMGFGLVFTLLLMFVKLRFQWWPLHPVAFPIAISAVVQSLTLTLFVTWLIKALLLRYGGMKAHRRALPFFLGLLAGGAAESMLRRTLSLILGVNLSSQGM